MQTQTDIPLNITRIIREMKHSDIQAGERYTNLKVFPYVEQYHAKKTSEVSTSYNASSNLSKILFNLNNKSKRNDLSHFHFITLKYQNAKYFNKEFISNVKEELKNETHEKINNKHQKIRSISEIKGDNNDKNKLSKKQNLKKLAIFPSDRFPHRGKHYHSRNYSLVQDYYIQNPEHNALNIMKCSIDDDINYIETKDASMNT